MWPCIQNSLNNRPEKNNEDEYSRYDALHALLYNISIICDEKVIDDIFSYMAIKLNDNNPRIITSAIYAFGAIVETVHVEKIETVIPDSIKSISNLFGKKNEELNLTLSWCLKTICQGHSRIILENTNVFKFLISTFSTLLKDQSLNNKIKMHICESIFK